MSSSEINIVGILRPKSGKMSRVGFSNDVALSNVKSNKRSPLIYLLREQLIELLSEIAERIHTDEKDITRFSVSREVDKKTKQPTNTLVPFETYESQVAFDRHFAAPEYAEFQATLKSENIIDFKDHIDPEIRVVKHVSGFM